MDENNEKEETINELTQNVSTLNNNLENLISLPKNTSYLLKINVVQCVFIILIGLYFIDKYYTENISLTTQLNIDKGDRIINMVKFSGVSNMEWISYNDALRKACNTLVDWSIDKSDDGTVFVQVRCRDLNDKHKERILNSKNIDVVKDYFVSLRVQYLIHTDGKNYQVGYKEIEYGKGVWYESKDKKQESLYASDYLKILNND